MPTQTRTTRDPGRRRKPRRRKGDPTDTQTEETTAAAPKAAKASPAAGPKRVRRRAAPRKAEAGLLADPATIAGTPSEGARDERDAELERLRAALKQRSEELDRLRASAVESPVAHAGEATPTPTAEDGPPRAEDALPTQTDGAGLREQSQGPSEPFVRSGQLLDAAAARRLAADARARERASREALAAAQRALAESLPPEIDAEALPDPTTTSEAPEAAGGWTRRALASTSATPANLDTTEEATPGTARRASPGTSAGLRSGPAEQPAETPPSATASGTDAADATGHDPEEGLRAAHAELQELRATLAIARDTAVGQREEISELRAALEALRAASGEATTSVSQPPATQGIARLEAELDAARDEIGRLGDRLREAELERRAGETERLALQRGLEERESLLATRSSQLEALRDRYEVQSRALDAARAEYEHERQRHGESRRLLARLRSALSEEPEGPELGAAAESGSGPPAAAPETLEAPARDTGDPVGTSAAERPPATPPIEDSAPPAATPRESALPACADAATADRPRPAIFELWQDDQIRRQFGPIGVDGFVDLLALALGRRERRGGSLPVLLLGRHASGHAPSLVEGLLERGRSEVVVHVADPAGESPLPVDSPMVDLIRPVEDGACVVEPELLARTLASLRPAVVIARDFLSRVPDVDPWLEAIAPAIEAGTALLLSERSGLGSDAPAEAICPIGERIWELMPERYTRLPDGGGSLPDWRTAFEASDTQPANGLVEALRARFRPELLTQFGHLAEPFLASPIGANFDPDAARDRRFLRQVADLDDRKIEAGLAPPLHLVALVDPLSEG